MANEQKRLILGNGQQLVDKIEKRGSGGRSELPRDYGEARELVLNNVREILRQTAQLPKNRKYSNEIITCLRLHPDMLAKSYDPQKLFTELPTLRNIGSRNWKPRLKDVAQTKRVIKQQAGDDTGVGIGRLIFVQSSDGGLDQLIQKLNDRESALPQEFKDDIRKIERLDLLSISEQVQGFSSEWTNGRVEMVLHPSRGGREQQLSFLNLLFTDLNVSAEKSRQAFYAGGPGFVSAILSREALLSIGHCNPLRAIQPLNFSGLPDLRSAPVFKAPPVPNSKTRSIIKVGVIDGGIDPKSPHLQGHAEEDFSLSINTPRDPGCVSHGTAVAGAVLYGPLERHDPDKPLPTPKVSVVSIRVLPTSDPSDIDLYECIDVIERAIPSRPDISIYNLSFGPVGPILDDTISRFTYSLDELSVNNDVLFFVAVGNDGHEPGSLNRIQSPSDLVHGIGVGAYTVRRGEKVRAPYSCKGPGREGAKTKPDFSAFGGCSQSPMHLLSVVPGMKIMECGTSFAAPIAASLGAQANGLYDRATPLLTRCLLTHCAKHPENDPDHELGHGCLPDSVEEVLNCSPNIVTVAYQGEVVPKTYYKLLIPIPENIDLPGLVTVSWTIGALCPLEITHPGDYTACCVEDTFYPDSNVYNFTLKQQGPNAPKKVLHLNRDKFTIEGLGKDWRQSDFPVSKSGNCYPTEIEKRVFDYKWDTIVRRSKRVYGNSLHKPFIVLHAIGRHAEINRFPYAAAVTISAPKYKGDLHAEIVRRFPVLQPIRIKNESEIQIRL
ncbi:MAG: S8 family peptidase [Verrucomicrobiales bacterium]